MNDAILTHEQRVALADRIERRIRELRGEITAALRHSEHPDALQLANHFEETDDAAVADLALATDIAEVERDLGEINALEQARGRIAQDALGICVDCGGPIPWARLDAFPGAVRCIGCQEHRERSRGEPAPPRL